MPIPPQVSVVALRTADLTRSAAFSTALRWELSAASAATMSGGPRGVMGQGRPAG